jgi:broad specificity phosphatase PhoE
VTSSAPSAASNPVRRLILLRHGQTEYNADSRMQGQLDTDLSELGRTQAKSAGPVIADRRPLTIVSSDLRRAYFTAVAVGEWQGLTHHDVDERTPGVRSAWRADATLAPPGGESRIDVANRSLPVVHELLDTHPDWAERPVVLVAHGGLIAALTAALLDLPVDRWAVLGGLGNTSWVQLSGHGDVKSIEWRLDVWNASASVANDVL